MTDTHINKFTASGHFHRTEPRNFKCKACHTFFGMKESYIHHLETESHQYVCNYCGITTATPSNQKLNLVKIRKLINHFLIERFQTSSYSKLPCRKIVVL